MRYEDFRAKALENPKIKAEYDALAPEYEARNAKIERDIRRRAARAKKDRPSQAADKPINN